MDGLNSYLQTDIQHFPEYPESGDGDELPVKSSARSLHCLVSYSLHVALACTVDDCQRYGVR